MITLRNLYRALALWILVPSLLGQSNDNFANRLPLTGPNPIAVSNLSKATAEPGEPNHAGSSIGKSLWWTWTAPATGVVNFSTFGNGGGSYLSYPARALAVYTGTSVSALAEVASSNGIFSSPPISSSSFAIASFNVSVTAGVVYQIAVDETEYGNGDDTVVLSINAPPTIVSQARATGVVGRNFSYTVTASNNPTALTATGLPAGLSFDPTAGVILGKVAQAGSWPVTISATNPGGTATATVVIAISDPPVPSASIASGALRALGTVGSEFTYYFFTDNQQIQVENLPPGLSLDSGNGVISGVPTTTGIYVAPYSTTSGAGTSGGVITFEISPPTLPRIINSLETTATVGDVFDEFIETSPSVANATYSVGDLPPGLVFDSVTHDITGLPTAPGVYHVPIAVSVGGATTTAVITIALNASTASPANAAPVLSGSANVGATVGSAFFYRLVAPGASSFTARNLPAGLSLNPASGEISGVPVAPGVSQIPVTAANGYGESDAVLTLTINASGGIVASTALTVSSPAEISGAVGVFLRYSFSFSPGTSFQQLSATLGSLPPGLVSSVSSSGASISGTPTTAGVYAVPVSFTGQSSSSGQSVNYSGSAVLTFSIGASGSAPTLAPGAITSVMEAMGAVGKTFSYSTSTLYSATGFAASGLPPGLSISATTGAISGKPTSAGSYPVTLTATNSAGTASAQVLIAIALTPTPPVISSDASVNGTVGRTLSYSISPGFGIIAYTASNLPPGLALNSTTGVISGTPTAAGAYAVPVSVNDGYNVADAVVTFTISDHVSIPIVTSDASVQGAVGSSFYYSYVVSPSSPSPTISVGQLPPGLTDNASSGAITGSPTQAGVFTTPITVTNSAGSTTANIEFIIASGPSFILSGSAEVQGAVGAAFSYRLINSKSLSNVTYTAANLPSGLTLNASTGVISGTPIAAGTNLVNISATYQGVIANAVLTIAITNQLAPLITSAIGLEGTVGASLSYTIAATNSPVSFSASGLPSGLSLNGANGIISGAPSASGSFPVSISATNGAGTSSATLNINVAAAPAEAPVISSAAEIAVTYSTFVNFTVTATNLPTSISVTNLPSGLTYNQSTHVISGYVAFSGGAATMTAKNAVGSGSATLTINVGTPIGAITSAAGAAGVAGGSFSYGITSTLGSSSYSSSALPTGLMLDSHSGIISGLLAVPAGTYTVSVTATSLNGLGSVSAPITIAVAGLPKRSPTLTSPLGGAALVGQPFSYAIVGTNAPTSWTASNLPAGLALDPTTGIISGSPTTAGVVQLSLSATNALGTGSGILNLTTAALPPVPVISSAIAYSAFVGSFAPLYTIVASNGPTSFDATNLPPGLSLDPKSGVISGTPTQAGAFLANVSAGNASGVAMAVVAVNVASAPPAFVSCPAATRAARGSALEIYLSVTDSGADISVSGLPAGVYFDANRGTIRGIPAQNGVFPFTVSASNTAGSSSVSGTLYVSDSFDPPVFSYGDAETLLQLGYTSTFPLDYSGAGPISVSAVGAPPGMALVLEPGYVYFTGFATMPGVYPVTFTATSPYGATSVVEKIVIQASPPFFSGAAAMQIPVNQSFSYSLPASNDITGCTAVNLPPGLIFDPGSGAISGIPTQPGIYAVPLSATNGGGTTAVMLTLSVVGADYTVSAPVINSAASVSYRFLPSNNYFPFSLQTPFSYTITGTNYPTSFSATNLPDGLTINPSIGLISGIPRVVGTYVATIGASNAVGTGTAQLTFVLSRSMPVLSEPLVVTGFVGAPLYHYIASDQSAPTGGSPARDVSFSAQGLPPGLSLNSSTGEVTGEPSQAGGYPVLFSVSNLAGTTTSTVTFQIRPVSALVSVPQFSSLVGASGLVGVKFNASVAASQAVSHWAAGLPPGLSIDPATGIVSGIPTAYGVFPVALTAANAVGSSSVIWTLVIYAHGSPIGLGASATIVEPAGAPFSQNLFASQTLGGAFVYSASNLPSGLTLDASTGEISGAVDNTGVYQIPVAVSSAGVVGAATLTLVVQPSVAPPFLSASAGYLGFVDVPFSGNVSSNGRVVDATPVPPGLSFDSGKGTISGLPSQSGVTAVNLSAANSIGASNAALSFLIATPSLSLPVITSQPTALAVNAGQPATFSAQAVGIPTPTYQWSHNGVPIEGSRDATLTLSTVGGADAGEYKVTASNSAGSVTSSTVLLFLQQSYGSWQTANFTRSDISQGLAGDLADYNGDGLCNLLKYALDRNPKTGAGGSAPTLALGSDGYLAFQFTRDPANTDIDYIVEASADLAHWDQIAKSAGGAAVQNTGGAHSVVEALGEGAIQVTVEDEVPAAFAASRWLRLKIRRH